MKNIRCWRKCFWSSKSWHG